MVDVESFRVRRSVDGARFKKSDESRKDTVSVSNFKLRFAKPAAHRLHSEIQLELCLDNPIHEMVPQSIPCAMTPNLTSELTITSSLTPFHHVLAT